MIKIITVGSLKENYLKEAQQEYLKRLSKYNNIEIVEIKDEGLVEPVKALKKEAESIKKHLNGKEYIITLDIEGKQLSSEELALKIDNILLENSNLVFIIGGSYGLSPDIKELSNLSLSFSKMTFPHQLFRIILLEQIYRSYKINNNESYHK